MNWEELYDFHMMCVGMLLTIGDGIVTRNPAFEEYVDKVKKLILAGGDVFDEGEQK